MPINFFIASKVVHLALYQNKLFKPHKHLFFKISAHTSDTFAAMTPCDKSSF